METRKLTKIWGNYAITDDGRVLNLRKQKEVPLVEKRDGYLRVILPLDLGERKAFNVARLVYESFKGNIPAGMEIDHINRDKKDNRLCNLRVVSSRENSHNSFLGDKRRKGVYYNKQRRKWMAGISLQGTRYYLGIYETEAAAEMAYKTALAEWMENGRTPEPKKHLPDDMKHCSGCGKDLPKSRFYYLAKYKRYSALCRDCHLAKMKEIRARKKETINP